MSDPYEKDLSHAERVDRKFLELMHQAHRYPHKEGLLSIVIESIPCTHCGESQIPHNAKKLHDIIASIGAANAVIIEIQELEDEVWTDDPALKDWYPSLKDIKRGRYGAYLHETLY
jgi:hypothetical protein